MGFFILNGILIVLTIISIVGVVKTEDHDRWNNFFGVLLCIFLSCSVVSIIDTIDSSCTHQKYVNFKTKYDTAVIMSKSTDLTFDQKIIVANKINKVNERILKEVNLCLKNEFWYGPFKNYEIAGLEYIEYDFE